LFLTFFFPLLCPPFFFEVFLFVPPTRFCCKFLLFVPPFCFDFLLLFFSFSPPPFFTLLMPTDCPASALCLRFCDCVGHFFFSFYFFLFAGVLGRLAVCLFFFPCTTFLCQLNLFRLLFCAPLKCRVALFCAPFFFARAGYPLFCLFLFPLFFRLDGVVSPFRFRFPVFAESRSHPG